jgi:hypothetical protein
MQAIPSSQDLLKEFADRHRTREGEEVDREIIPIRAMSLSNILVTSTYSSLDESAFGDPAIGLLLNMLHRNFSLVDGAILAFVGECGQMAEVAARASVEASVNIAYISLGEPADRLRAYFDHYFATVDKQIKTWSTAAAGLSGAEAEAHRKAIERRREANGIMRDAIARSVKPASEPWPRTIEDRFKVLGHPLDYRTIYSRMSSETHADAEETLRYLVGRLGTEEQFEAMALETVWMTRLYIHYAVSWFVRASMLYAARYNMMEAAESLKPELIAVEAELAEISKHVGGGP